MKRDWKDIWNIFDPFIPLVGRQENLYVDREDSPLSRIKLSLQPGRHTQKVLLVGQRGSGKSSLLAQLAHLLADDYFLVWFDLNQSLDAHSMTILDLLLGFGGGIHKMASTIDVSDGAPYLADMIGAINTVLLEPKDALSIEGFLNHLVCAKGDISQPLDIIPMEPPTSANFSLNIKSTETIKKGSFLREMLKRTQQIASAVEQKIAKPILVIVDGLDKMSPGEASQLFEFSDLLGQLNFHFVATLPHSMYLTHDSPVDEYFELFNLPNIRLAYFNDRNKKYEPGYQTIRTVCQKRFDALNIPMDDVIDPAALEMLIPASAGIMRGIMRLFRNAINYVEDQGSDRILGSHVQKAIEDERLAMDARLSSADKEFLKKFHEEAGKWPNEERPRFLNLFQNGAIVAYAESGHFWYDVNQRFLPLE